MYRTECTMFSEVYMGNPGKVPYCNERDKFEPDCTNCERPNVTKADKIRAMADEELAKKISGIESFALTRGGGWPPAKWLDWLKQEAE